MKGQASILLMIIALVATAAVASNFAQLSFSNNVQTHSQNHQQTRVIYSSAPIIKNVTFTFHIPKLNTEGIDQFDIFMYTSDDGNKWSLYKQMSVLSGTETINFPLYGKYVKFIFGNLYKASDGTQYVSMEGSLLSEYNIGQLYQHTKDINLFIHKVLLPDVYFKIDGKVSDVGVGNSAIQLYTFNYDENKTISILYHKRLQTTSGYKYYFEDPIVCLFYDPHTLTDVYMYGDGVVNVKPPQGIEYMYSQHVSQSDSVKCYKFGDNFWDKWHNISISAGNTDTNGIDELTMAVIDAGDVLNANDGSISHKYFYEQGDQPIIALGNAESPYSGIFVFDYQVVNNTSSGK